MFAKLTRRDRIAALAGAVAIGLFVLSNYVVFPLLDRLAQSPDAVQQKEINLHRDQRLLAEAGLEKTHLATAGDHLKELESGLLESPSPTLANAEWQHLVSQVADSKGIELGSSEFVRTQDLGAGYSLITGQVQFRCRLDQLVDFLVALASSPKLLSITRISLTAPQSADPQSRMNVILTIGAAAPMVKRAQARAASPN